MTDPYKVLGVSPNASDEDIKKAYRELARKYHPDRYAESDLKDLANEKMQEINAAYEEIQTIRKNGGNRFGSGSQSGGGSTYHSGQTASNQGGSELYSRIRVLINNGHTEEAEQLLNSVASNRHDAEWFFLMGCVLLKKGRYLDAQQYFNTACGMDPYNMEYRNARDRLAQQTGGFGNAYQTSDGGCSFCDVCQALICADCCCSMSRGC